MKQVLYLLIGCLYLGSGVMEGQARQFENNPLLWSPKPGITDGVQLVDTSGVAAGAAHEGGALADSARVVDSVLVVTTPPMVGRATKDSLALDEEAQASFAKETQVSAEAPAEASAPTSASTEEAGAQKRAGGVDLP